MVFIDLDIYIGYEKVLPVCQYYIIRRESMYKYFRKVIKKKDYLLISLVFIPFLI